MPNPALRTLASIVEFGNAGDTDTQGTGWFVGFSNWTRGPTSALRHVPTGTASTGLCVKWFAHAAGDPNGEAKPLSEGRSLSILVSPVSEFRIEFCTSSGFAPGEVLAHTLRRQGDFVAWGTGVYHRSFGVLPACVMTVRWADDA